MNIRHQLHRFSWLCLLCIALCSTATQAQQAAAAPASAASAALSECGARWAGLRQDDRGHFVPCDRPCMLVTESPHWRTWTVDGASCTTQTSHDADPNSHARDRILRHGETAYWEQWTGSMRGQLIEQCRDGNRTVAGVRCSVATHCDTAVEFTRGGEAYSYNGRGLERRVPNGTTVQARSVGGRTWPAKCEAGSWQVPESLPTAPATPASRPAQAPGCGPQLELVGRRYWRYTGPRVAPGEIVVATAVDGSGETARAVCLRTGRFRGVL